MTQIMVRSGGEITVSRPVSIVEKFVFSSEREADERLRLVTEALAWIGTPFVDCGDVKGPRGAVDCAMMLVRSAIDTGLRPPFDPRPYSPGFMMHSDEQKFAGWILNELGGHEVGSPTFGDVVVWQFGRSFCHGGLLINRDEVVHAYKTAGMCLISKMSDDLLMYLQFTGSKVRRPVKYFSMWRD